MEFRKSVKKLTITCLLTATLSSPTKADTPPQSLYFYRQKALGLSGKAAIEMWEKVLEIVPKDKEAILNIADEYIEIRDHENVIRWSLKATEVYPRCGICYSNAGNSSRALGRYAQAIAYYKKALSLGNLSTDWEETYRGLGIIYLKLGNKNEAEKYAIEGLKRNPHVYQYYENEGFYQNFPHLLTPEMHEKFKKIESQIWKKERQIWKEKQEAIEQKKQEQMKKLRSSYYYRAEKLFSEGKYEESIKLLIKEIKKNPKKTEAYRSLATAFTLLGKNDDALQWNLYGIKRNPQDGELHRMAGLNILQRQKYHEALSYFNKAIALGYKNAYVDIAGAYYLMGNSSESEKYLHEALKFSNNTEQTMRMMKAYKYIDKYNKISTVIQRIPYLEILSVIVIAAFIVSYMSRHLYYLHKGDKYFSEGKYEKAVNYYEKLLDANKLKMLPLDKLKETYIKLERKDKKAITVYEKAYHENPSDHELIKFLAGIYADTKENKTSA